MRGKFVSGTVAALEARLNLPTWNGVQLTSKGSQSIPTIQTAGSYIRNNVSTEKGGMLFIEPYVSYLTFGPVVTFGTSSTNATSKVNGSDITIAGSTIVITARIPIEGWENSNIIIGQFNGLESCTDTYQCTDTFSAKVSSAGVVSDENLDFISGNCTIATNAATCTFRSGVFTVTPNCVVATQTGGGGAISGAINPNGITGFTAVTYNTLGSQVANDRLVVCQKQGVDYIGKTAKAVASDQNLRTPGITNSKVCSFYVSGGSFTRSSACSSSPCSIVKNYGSCASSVTWSATANYTINWNSSYWSDSPICSIQGVDSANGRETAAYLSADPTTSTYSFQMLRSGTPANSFFWVNCHGYGN